MAACMSLRARPMRAGWLRSERAERPVVIVGNLTVGGTGKTPLTCGSQASCRRAALKVGIAVARLRAAGMAPRVVLPESDWREVGDEPLLLARRSGAATVVARDRAARCAPARRSRASSHPLRMMACSTCVWRATARSWSSTARAASATGGCCPPDRCASRRRRLAGADLVVVNGAPAHASLAGIGAGPPLLRMDLIAGEARRLNAPESRPLAAFRGQRVHAVAGIGNPQRFFRELRAQGMDLIEHAFPGSSSAYGRGSGLRR